MTKKEKKALAEALKQALKTTDEIFINQTKSLAYIIGYLEGTIKTAIRELED